MRPLPARCDLNDLALLQGCGFANATQKIMVKLCCDAAFSTEAHP